MFDEFSDHITPTTNDADNGGDGELLCTYVLTSTWEVGRHLLLQLIYSKQQ